MKKRRFNKTSVLLVIILASLLGALSSIILGKDTPLGNLLSGIISLIASFVISRGLLVNRMGGVGDYLSNVKKLNFKFVITNILILLLMIIINLILFGTMIIGFVRNSGDVNYYLSLISAGFGMIALSIILMLIIQLITAYTNFVVSDPRNKDLSIIESIKEIISIGIALIGKTFLSMLKYFIIPLIVFSLIIVFIISDTIKNQGDPSSIFVAFVLIVIFALLYIYLLIKYIGEMSDHYLNFTGDLDHEFLEYNDINNKDSFKITRKIEKDYNNYKEDLEEFDTKNL